MHVRMAQYPLYFCSNFKPHTLTNIEPHSTNIVAHTTTYISTDIVTDGGPDAVRNAFPDTHSKRINNNRDMGSGSPVWLCKDW